MNAIQIGLLMFIMISLLIISYLNHKRISELEDKLQEKETRRSQR